MYETDRVSPNGGNLWEYEIEYDPEEEIYRIEDPRWQEVEYEKIYSSSPVRIQKFRGKSALERNLEDDRNWSFDRDDGDKMVYRSPSGFEVRFSDDAIEVDTLGIEVSDLMSYELEAWLHCREAMELNEIIDKELS